MRTMRGVVAFLVMASLIGIGGCKTISSWTGGGGGGNQGGTVNGAPQPSATASKACILRVTFATLLQEHVCLVGATTDAAIAGRQDEFRAGQAAVDKNAVALQDALSNVFDPQTADQFLTLWRKYNGYLFDYAMAQASNNQDGQDKAIGELEGFTEDFGGFLDQATASRLTKDSMADMFKENILGMKAMIDAQAAKDYVTAFTKEMIAEQDAQTLAATLSDEFVAQFPQKFTNDQ